MTDVISFLRAWLSGPLRVGAVAPSSLALADLITAEITPASAPVIELGPGTGVFTRALIARGVPQEKLALVENASEFARMLAFRFPAARVLWMDAAQLEEVDPFHGQRAGAVVSGLPLWWIPPEKVTAILEAAFHHLRPDGALYQFTYVPRCPVARGILERLSLEATRAGRTLANVPPASVYRIRRVGSSADDDDLSDFGEPAVPGAGVGERPEVGEHAHERPVALFRGVGAAQVEGHVVQAVPRPGPGDAGPGAAAGNGDRAGVELGVGDQDGRGDGRARGPAARPADGGADDAAPRPAGDEGGGEHPPQ